MARERDDYDVAALRAELAELRQERQQERAEMAMVRADYARMQNAAEISEEEKRKRAEFLAWVGLTAEQKTQLVADRDYNADPAAGPYWEVSFPEQPTVRLRGHSEFDVIGRYNQLCGITATHPDRKHAMRKLAA